MRRLHPGNPYAYAGNSPLVFGDPFGLQTLNNLEFLSKVHRAVKLEHWRDDRAFGPNDIEIPWPMGGGFGTAVLARGPVAPEWYLMSKLAHLDVLPALQAERKAAWARVEQSALNGFSLGVGVASLAGSVRYLLARQAARCTGNATGLYGSVSRAKLQSLASGGGPTTSVVTRLSGAPEAGRALSVATGEGMEALAAAGRGGLTAYRGSIPTALIGELEAAGLAFRSTTMQAGVASTEIRFMPQATEFVIGFLK